MNRTALALAVVATASALALVEERDAKACGGCFQPPTQTVTDITDERMLLAVSPTQTTLYDQIEYAGNPASFAWVLPIHGTVTVARPLPNFVAPRDLRACAASRSTRSQRTITGRVR